MIGTEAPRTETFVEVADGYRLWVETIGEPDRPPLLLVMGANATGLGWPEPLVERLAKQHWVIRYDHRDTGRSTRAFHERPYPLRDLAPDAVAVLGSLGAARAHVVGMSLGGTLVQLMMLDAPERLLSATVFGTSVLGGAAPHPTIRDEDLPGPDAGLVEPSADFGEDRDEAAELVNRLELRRVLQGTVVPFDTDEFAELECRVAKHSGTWLAPAAHAVADRSGMERGAELAAVTVPTLVIEAPADPLVPPPHAERLAHAIPTATLVTIPGLGHSLPEVLVAPLADAIARHTSAA